MKTEKYTLKFRKPLRIVRGDDYKSIFNIENGFFARWGKNRGNDPQFSPIGPELLDIEVSTICHRSCSWCYKSNTVKGKIMSFGTFKAIFDKIPKSLNQIAFGIGDLDTNPDLWDMLKYCRENKVVPNITINGSRLNNELAVKLVRFCGAVAVSHYEDDDCFNAVKLLIDKGLTQVNIHKLVAKETLDSCYDLLDATKQDSCLTNLNAIVFLTFKKKGERNILFHPLSKQKFTELVNNALKNNIRIGFDSCAANKVLEILKDHPNFKVIKMMLEPCESTCFSLYINANGIVYPCSFLEGENGYNGVDLTKIDDFLKDVWKNPEIIKFRTDLVNNNRICPHFKI